MKRRARYDLKEYLFIAGLVIVLVWLSFAVYGIAIKEEVARKAVKDTEEELQMLERRKATLEADLQELETERGQEAVLREVYGVARPGEHVIVVVPPEEPLAPPPLPWWKKLVNFFTGG